MLSKIKAHARLPMSPSSSLSLLLLLLLLLLLPLLPLSSTNLSFTQDAASDLDCTTTSSSTTNLPFSQDAATNPNCTNTFSCGFVTSITYPFSSATATPETCGPPEFRLTCHDNHTELTTNSFTYRVVQINQDQQTIDLARLDLWNNTCPLEFINPTLNPSIFTLSNSANEDLTLAYGCNTTTMTVQPHNRFKCSVSGINSTDSYYWIGPVPTDPPLNIIKCTNRVSLPILKTTTALLSKGQMSLPEALTMGFRVNYTDPYRYSRTCRDCTRSGSICRFNTSLDQPVCICGDSQCLLTGNGSSKRNTLNIVLSVVGAIVAGIAIGWLFFFCRQRRKRQAMQSAYQTESGLPSPLSSKPQTTNPSTNLTRSIPSYPSTTTEFGKSDYFGLQIFTYAELEKATDNFDRSKELGDGGFGKVYYGKLVDGREVAVKLLYENNFKRLEQFINEVEILTHLKHDNLVKLYGCTSKRSRELLLVYEYISNGTVADHLHGKRPNSVSGLLSWPVRLNIAIETACALSYLHDSDIIHRDVKTNNILLDNNFRVKVADFGLSRLFPNDATHVSTAPQGTPGYVDPEYYQCYQLTDKSDVYSFGVVLIELLSSLEAVDTNRYRQHINLSNMAVDKIQNHLLHELVDKTIGFETDNTVRRMATLVAELAFRCLQQDKDMRPTMKEVLEILRGIQNDELNGQKQEILDIVVDNGGSQVKDNNASPPSPASSVTDRLVGSTPNSSG